MENGVSEVLKVKSFGRACPRPPSAIVIWFNFSNSELFSEVEAGFTLDKCWQFFNWFHSAAQTTKHDFCFEHSILSMHCRCNLTLRAEIAKIAYTLQSDEFELYSLINLKSRCRYRDSKSRCLPNILCKLKVLLSFDGIIEIAVFF